MTCSLSRLAALLAAVLLPALQAAPPALLALAVRQWNTGKDDWAFTQRARTYDGDNRLIQERLERFDPSKPDNQRWHLLEMNGQPLANTFSIKFARPNLYLIQWKRVPVSTPVSPRGGPRFANQGAVWSANNNHFLLLSNIRYYRFTDANTAFGAAVSSAGSFPLACPVEFFGWDWHALAPGLSAVYPGARPPNSDFIRSKDVRVGTNDCYVLSAQQPALKITLWIGKQDWLIHQSRLTKGAMPVHPLDDKAVTELLTARNLPVTPATIAMAKTMMQQQIEQFMKSDITLTETDENISVDETFSKQDFIQPVPAALRASAQFP